MKEPYLIGDPPGKVHSVVDRPHPPLPIVADKPAERMERWMERWDGVMDGVMRWREEYECVHLYFRFHYTLIREEKGAQPEARSPK